MHCVKRVAVAREELQQHKKINNSTRKARKELQQHKKINNSTRKAIQLKKNDNNIRRVEATQEERKQCQKNMQQHEKSNPTPEKQYAIHRQEQEHCQANNEKQN
jgi:hypothetical protein